MPLARQLSVLSLYDVLTDLIPGATVLLFALLIFPIESTAVVESDAMLVFMILLGSLIVGHIVQWLRGKFGKQPNEFQQRMETVRSGSDEESSIEKDFLRQTNDYFDIEDEFDDGERFRFVLSYLETRPSVRALRFQSVYSFYRSLFVAALLGVGFSIVALIFYMASIGIPSRGIPYIVFVGGAAGLLAHASRQRRNKFESLFVGYVIREFYAEQITSETNS